MTARLREFVAAMMLDGATVGQAENVIATFDLDEEREAALWLYAWSLAEGRAPGSQAAQDQP